VTLMIASGPSPDEIAHPLEKAAGGRETQKAESA